MDIAREANVSAWTVSQAINGHLSASISQPTRDRVLAIAAQIGYRPNHAARALVNARTNLVATWMRTHVEYSPYYGRIQHSLQRIARRYGYNCIAEDVVLDEVEQQDFSKLISWPMDGVIACDVGGPVAAYLAVNPRERMPIVNIGAWSVDTTDSVKLDLVPGMLAAARHLVDGGCTRIAYISRLPFDMRSEAYSSVMRDAGRRAEFIEAAVDTRVCARETLTAYAKEHGLPDGLLCENDDVAIGCLCAALDLGARVPRDIAIVGCDGIEDAENQVLPVSTVKVPIETMCESAWTFLVNRINDPSAPLQRAVITPGLVVRDSSRR